MDGGIVVAGIHRTTAVGIGQLTHRTLEGLAGAVAQRDHRLLVQGHLAQLFTAQLGCDLQRVGIGQHADCVKGHGRITGLHVQGEDLPLERSDQPGVGDLVLEVLDIQPDLVQVQREQPHVVRVGIGVGDGLLVILLGLGQGSFCLGHSGLVLELSHADAGLAQAFFGLGDLGLGLAQG